VADSSTGEVAGGGPEHLNGPPTPPGRALARSARVGRTVRVVLTLAVLAVAGVALADRWKEVQGHLSHVSPFAVLGAFGCMLVALFMAMMAWRALLTGFGSHIPVPAAMRIVFVSALGKYLPGSIWPYLAQIELGREHHVPRTRSAAVSVLTVLVSLITALIIAAATLPWASAAATKRFWPVFIALPVLIAVLHPRILNALLVKAGRILRRPTFDEQVTPRAMLVAVAWTASAALLSGIQIWLLAINVASVGIRALPVCVGAYALAWSAGFLFIIAPAGAGVREAAMVACLTPIMSATDALLIALLSRLITTAADFTAAGAIFASGAKNHLAALRSRGDPDTVADETVDELPGSTVT